MAIFGEWLEIVHATANNSDEDNVNGIFDWNGHGPWFQLRPAALVLLVRNIIASPPEHRRKCCTEMAKVLQPLSDTGRKAFIAEQQFQDELPLLELTLYCSNESNWRGPVMRADWMICLSVEASLVSNHLPKP